MVPAGEIFIFFLIIAKNRSPLNTILDKHLFNRDLSQDLLLKWVE